MPHEMMVTVKFLTSRRCTWIFDERGHLNLKHSKITITLLYNDSVVDTLTKVLCLQQISSKSAASQQLTEF